MAIPINKRKVFCLKDGTYLSYSYHLGRSVWFVEIFVEGKPKFENGRWNTTQQTRNLFASTRKELGPMVRLALARGNEDIFWDEKIMNRLVPKPTSPWDEGFLAGAKHAAKRGKV